MAKAYYTLDYQFKLAQDALREARNLNKAKYWTSCISQSYQVAHRCAAGLLFAVGASVHTERDVGLGFEGAFVSTKRSPDAFATSYRRLFDMRQKADFEYEYVASQDEAAEALRLAEAFHEEAQRLKGIVASQAA